MQYLPMNKTIRNGVLDYLEKEYPTEKDSIVKRADVIYPKLLEKATEIGGKKNWMAGNMYQMLAFLAFYEASDKRLDGHAIETISEYTVKQFESLGKWMNFNSKIVGFLAKYIGTIYMKSYSKKVARKKKSGEWGNTWGILVNPDDRKEGLCFHLVGCPLAEFAKENGYEELMPYLCKIDYASAKVMHAKLIRTHTVAGGSATCDYWYVGDRSETAKKYEGLKCNE